MSRIEYACPGCKAVMIYSKRPLQGPPLERYACRYCRESWPFFRLVTHFRTDNLLYGGAEIYRITLLQTLYANANRDVIITGMTEDQANTFAGTHDASDSTADVFSEAVASDLHTATVTYDIDSFTVAAKGISFLRFKARGKSDNGTFAGIKPGGVLNSHPSATRQDMRVFYQDFSWDAPAKIGGTAWTPADLLATQIGFSFSVDPDATLPNTFRVPECWLEVWGIAQ